MPFSFSTKIELILKRYMIWILMLGIKEGDYTAVVQNEDCKGRNVLAPPPTRVRRTRVKNIKP